MKVLAIVLLLASICQANVRWTRFTGRVKHVDLKENRLTIQNKEGDLIDLKVDRDVTVIVDNEARRLQEITYGDKVVVMNSPKAPEPKEEGEMPSQGIFKPAR